MANKKKFVSLRVKLLKTMILALVIAAATFVVIKEVGDFLVWRYYMDEQAQKERIDGYIFDFQEYVKKNKLSVNNHKKISDWSRGKYFDMVFYKNSSLIYAPEWFEDYEAETESERLDDDSWFSGERGFEQYLTEEARIAYRRALDDILKGNRSLSPVYFSDGTLLVTVVDYSEDLIYNIIFVFALVFAFAVLAIIMMLGFTRLVFRVKRLAQDIRLAESTNSTVSIALDGDDELALLADDVNSMRNSVVDNMTKERQAWEANTGLITAMSHDIRTPLTVMLGYLDLLELQNENPDSKEYITACKENALRLKRLSDEMFSYFLVFGKKDVDLNVDAQSVEVVGNMIAEHEFLLEENGCVIENSGTVGNAVILADTVYLGRVIGNIFSNIDKYADKNEPIYIDWQIADGELVITFKNRMSDKGEKAESNGIGLKTCVRIMEKMHGGFKSIEQDNCFIVELRLPCEKDLKESE